MQAKPFIDLVSKIPGFEFDMLQLVAKAVCNEAYIEIDYVQDGHFETLEWGNITSKQEYEYVAAFVRECLVFVNALIRKDTKRFHSAKPLRVMSTTHHLEP